MMQRATKLPECDWGLEYSQGPSASIAYVPRARALARLNTLEGMRQLASGDTQSAVNTWLAGVRFSQDLARGGPLIFALMSKAALLPNFRMLTGATANGKLNEAQKRQVTAVIRALPEDGLNWGTAWGYESATLEQFLHELQTAPNAGAAYEAVMGTPAPKQGLHPTVHDIQAYREYMLAVQSALREPPEKAKIRLDGLAQKRASLSEVERNITPDPQKSNHTRIDVMSARAELLQALAKMIHLRATVQGVVPLADYSGKVTPVDSDPRFVLTVRIESVDPAVGSFTVGAVVAFAIHSPALLFGEDPTKGEKYDFSLQREIKHGKTRLFGLKAEKV